MRTSFSVITFVLLGFSFLLASGSGTMQYSETFVQEKGSQPATIDSVLLASLKTTVDSLRTAMNLPGLACALMLPDGSILKTASNVSTNDLFGMASQTKQMTSALMLILAEEGKLRLDDSLYKFLPAMANIDSTITIRQLLGMKSGLSDFLDYPNFFSTILPSSTERFTIPEVLSYIRPPVTKPGANYAYVNSNYLLCSLIIEKVTGKPIGDLFHEKLWKPLKLTRTYFYETDSVVPPVALNHFTSSFWETRAQTHFDRAWSTLVRGAAGVFSTVEDMTVWLRALSGQNTVLSSHSLREMETYTPLGTLYFDDPYTAYGLGIMSISICGYNGFGHDGGWFGYRSQTLHFRSLGVTLSVAINHNNVSAPQFEILFSALLQTYLKRAHSNLPPPSRSVIIAGGIADSGAVYSLDTTTFTHTLIGRNYSAEIAGIQLGKDNRLLSFTKDFLGWHLNSWSGATANGPIVTRLTGLDNYAINSFRYRHGTFSIFSVGFMLFKFDNTTGANEYFLQLFVGDSVVITGIDSMAGKPDFWISVNKGELQKDLIYRINIATGDTFFVGSAGLGVQLNDIAFSPNGQLYGITADSPSRLVWINQSNGQATVLGNLKLKDAKCLTFTGSVNSVPSSISVPERFMLFQNYPNPFNPSTTIRYSLPSTANVKLAIYDLLGREIATLVNEEQSAGWMEVQWMASAFCSGIYFYKIQADNFAETKKMILMK